VTYHDCCNQPFKRSKSVTPKGSGSLYREKSDKKNRDEVRFSFTASYFFAKMTLPRKNHILSTDKGAYEWQECARVTGESIVMGTEPRINVEHALHVLEIIEAARKSQQTGARIKLKSKFPWPIVK
jgi:predicted dehydrogenase